MADPDTSKRGTVVDEWVFWILTCAFSLYFVVLLLEFNRPSQKWMEQIDNQEVRRLAHHAPYGLPGGIDSLQYQLPSGDGCRRYTTRQLKL